MYTLTRYNDRNFFNPFHEMEQLTRNFFGNNSFGSYNGSMFNMDIADKGDTYELSADLPGMNKDDIHLDLDDNTLTISAERHSEYEDRNDSGYIRMERSYGSFSRSLDVSAVDVDNITASYTDGVLKLVMPKKQEEIPTSRRLEIQ